MSAVAILSPLQHNPLQEEEEQDDNDHLMGAGEANPAQDDDADDRLDEDEESVPSLFAEEMEADIEKSMKESVPRTLGGLNNLGNTCYLNSAVQMLASLDGFGDLLKASPPEETRDELRDEFLSVLDKLASGETVNPRAFKSAIDARSSLFIGYRQQDSHEFLTTLLDLLDADYKKKPDDEEMEEDDEEEEREATEQKPIAGDDNARAEADDSRQQEDDDDAVLTESPMVDAVLEESESTEATDEHARQQEEEEDAVLTESLMEDAVLEESESAPLLPVFAELRSRSLTELQMDDISELLHGQEQTGATAEPGETAMVPQCKLIGGRAIVPSSGVIALSSMDTEGAETMSAVQDTNQTGDAAARNQEEQEEEDPSPVEEYFTTQVRARLTCDSCKYTRSHVEKYLHLSLDIGSDSGSVEEGLRAFFDPEKRQIRCEKCFCETATQTLEIIKLPRALLLHCKRFIVDVSPDYTSITYRKNRSPFTFDDALSAKEDGILGEFLAPDVADMPQSTYTVKSVVNHIGSSASCGHYTADGNRSCGGQRKWTRFNDSFVSQISADDAMGDSAQRTAYMVMYEL